MYVFDLLQILNSDIQPKKAKIHLAGWNGEENPIDVYLAGQFEDWQSWQSRKNFERQFVISLISMPQTDKWLFAGVYFSIASKWHNESKRYYYELIEDPLCNELNGRLVVSFQRSGRQSYLNSENWSSRMLVSEIFAATLSIGEFPGFKAVNITFQELLLIFRNSLESWRIVLSSVAGIYLISDTETGKLYIGSASGEGGIWHRWASYAANGHGGNSELYELIIHGSIDRAKQFRFSILEIADTHASREDIFRRESHWKNILMSRTYGLNAN